MENFMFRSNSFITREMRSKRRKTLLTVILLGFLISIFLFGYLAFGENQTGHPTLVQLHILFRHGERTPSSKYPTDQHSDIIWPDGPGALTNKGKQSMYEFGKTLRMRYHGFLSEYYSPEELYVISSYAPRCQMSAMTLLAGLYPPIGKQVWNKDLLWQPIPVNPIPRNIDNLITAKAPCLAFNDEKKKSDIELHNNLTEKDNKVFSYLSEKTNLFIENIGQVEQLYSILKIEDENGLVIPEWTKTVFPEPMKTFTQMNLESYSRTPKLKRLQGGPLLKEWLQNIKTSSKKIHLYAGHDITLVTLMRTIGVTTAGVTTPPDYGASFILEVHHVSNKKILKAFYFNSNKDFQPINLLLPDCEPMCTVETLTDTLKAFIPDDWDQECKTNLHSMTI
ncbi:prostatic acid phosphatase [Halyomorpha halys]|uniref:prostatic acid phosphatase n=1 Tax=Halyomorpha halys TaxID=286706 RepID=UPI0006D4F843|nr:prostatic acid phosphatase [Halyomorpha halys]